MVTVSLFPALGLFWEGVMYNVPFFFFPFCDLLFAPSEQLFPLFTLERHRVGERQREEKRRHSATSPFMELPPVPCVVLLCGDRDSNPGPHT